MARRLLLLPLLSGGLLTDAALGALQPGSGHPPLVTLAVVAAIALAGGVRVGLVTGFGAGVALDLLAGTASLAGTLTLVGLTLGALVGSQAAGSDLHPTGGVALSGALAVAGGGLLVLGLRALGGGSVGPLVGDVLLWGALMGVTITPLVFRIAVWPLFQSAAAS
jgi:hypothetical protein